MMSGAGDDDGGSVGKGHALHHGGPAADGRALEAEEALDVAAFTELGPGPGGRQAGSIPLSV